MHPIGDWPVRERTPNWYCDANTFRRKTMSSRPRYQYGCLTRMRRSRGKDPWQFRFYETTKEGQRERRARTIGTIAQYPTKADALRAIELFRRRLNLKHRFPMPTTIRALADRYVEQELPDLRYSTQRSYLSVLNQWIGPHWGDCLLEELKPVPVEQWLRSLQLAPKSKVHIRSLLHLLYQCARRWELTDANPIDLVRQSGGRRGIPPVFTAEQICLLLEQISHPYHTMVLIAACLGLRVSEIMGLQWGDFDWENFSVDRKSTRLNSSHTVISYAVFCLKKKKKKNLNKPYLRHFN